MLWSEECPHCISGQLGAASHYLSGQEEGAYVQQVPLISHVMRSSALLRSGLAESETSHSNLSATGSPTSSPLAWPGQLGSVRTEGKGSFSIGCSLFLFSF